MFVRLGDRVARSWPLWLTVWIVVLVTAIKLAPPLDSVVQTGEFAFLPEDSPSRVAERLFAQGFPQDAKASTIAIVVRRLGGEQGLTDADKEFIHSENLTDGSTPDDLRTRLIALAAEHGDQPAESATNEDEAEEAENASPVRTFRDKTVGRYLLSEDQRAALVLLELPTEFMDSKNKPLVKAVEQLLYEDATFKQKIPAGLDLALSGTAVVGRDMLQAAKDSAKATEHLTIILVVALLILIYRAPLLALIPLSTVFVSVKLTMALLCIAAKYDLVILFTGVESYVTVLLYGAGVDYCLFLIARYKEEVDQGIEWKQAVADSVNRVGAAIAASAGTVICGIGMMIFAEFGKFHEAGMAISFGLVIVLLASLTFTPALLRLTGPWVFWPQSIADRAAHPVEEHGWLQQFWDHVGAAILKRPLAIWMASIALMLPFAIVGVVFYTHLSYGLLTDLPTTARSVVGTKVVQQHFPAGATGPVTVLIQSDRWNFASRTGDDAGLNLIGEATTALGERREELQLSDIRSVSHPFGGDESLDSIRNPVRLKSTTKGSVDRYVSRVGETADHLTRLELTAGLDPFSRDSIAHLTHLEAEITKSLPAELRADAKVLVLGPTASIRDLKHVTDRDQVRIDLLVVAGVFLILLLLLRQPAVCSYLILSVLFSYLVTLGITYLSFWWWDGAEFAGLDWKVPMFLFTILIAVGEDYNIFLMTRIHEEQVAHGAVKGIVQALSKTGRIISSCGIIMAGTFLSLSAGYLKGMSQLGFALAVGVLLDTFIVRPVLVPAYLVLLSSGRFGSFGRWLGSHTVSSPATPPPTRAMSEV